MPEPLRIAVAGLGRMGSVHAKNVIQTARESGSHSLAALIDCDRARLHRFAEENGCNVPLFESLEDFVKAELCQATLVATPTDKHREHVALLARAGHRVLVEKPLTGTFAGDREFASELEARHPNALMLAFQRRFDAALQYARELMHSGVVGKVFKIYSALEDSNPAPDGYQSDGILPDMSIHNVDEILWLTGRMPDRALVIGSRIYSHRLTTCQEDFDDALLCLWFGDDLLAHVQVSRNHVSGYRVEAILYGDKGQIQIGRFSQRPEEVLVEAYGRRLQGGQIVRRAFPGGTDTADQPEFVARFGEAYRAEVRVFVDCCLSDRPFPTSHRDALRAQQVIAAGMQRPLTRTDAHEV